MTAPMEVPEELQLSSAERRELALMTARTIGVGIDKRVVAQEVIDIFNGRRNERKAGTQPTTEQSAGQAEGTPAPEPVLTPDERQVIINLTDRLSDAGGSRPVIAQQMIDVLNGVCRAIKMEREGQQGMLVVDASQVRVPGSEPDDEDATETVQLGGEQPKDDDDPERVKL